MWASLLLTTSTYRSDKTLYNSAPIEVKMLHFQYNGLLSGLLLLSISSLASHSVLLAGLLFSGLLMFKVRMAIGS